MSQKNKRLKNHIKELSVINQKQEELENMISMLTKTIQSINLDLAALEVDYNQHINYIYSKDDAIISYNILQLPDGTEIDVMILETDDMVVVAHDGKIGKAKKHDTDNFDFNKGYNLACMRLMNKLFDY